MYNIKTDIKIDGDVEFTGSLIGNLPPVIISPDSGNSISNHDNGLYSPPSLILKSKDVKVLHVFQQDNHDLTIRSNNAGMLMRMKDIFTNETNVNIVSFIPLGCYVYTDSTTNNSVDVSTTVGVTSGYDMFVSMSPNPNKVYIQNTHYNCSVTNSTLCPIVRIFYTSD
ncbi:hypothetical protein pEaSNUABM49_00222 [Erwinia phage pEa_SNUABM_49]|nr:hypothetical protein pEaSNUABM49_00222 [Erwinia phage pEa_SNUABM_49]